MDANEKLEALKKFRAEMAGKDHFALLGVGLDATDDQVRAAYFGLMKMYGADYFHHVVDPDDRAAIEEVNRQLRVAYNEIGRAAKRDAYRAALGGGSAKPMQEHVDFESVFEAEQALSLARTLMDRGNFNVAIQKLEKAAKLDGKSQEVEARLLYSRYMLMDVDAKGKRNPEEVKNTRERLEAIADEMPNADYVRVYLGDIENLDGTPEKAQKWYKAALRINDDNIAAKRAVMLFETRAKQPKAEEPEPAQGFLDKLKKFFTKKL